MCLNEHDLSFQAGERFLHKKADLCNKNLSLNRELICQALNVCVKSSEKVLYCLDGNSPCGLMGMMWKKYLGERVNVEVNGSFNHSLCVIQANIDSNDMDIKVIKEDPGILLRQRTYDFIFFNCKTSAAMYFDSVFKKLRDDSVAVFTTSEDPSLHWQSPASALRNYGGNIMRTTYYRELGIRLVIAEMARAAARYGKGIKVLCSVFFKFQQSFTIFVKVIKGNTAALESIKLIKKVLHCTMCEDRVYAPNSDFILESPGLLLSCDCRNQFDANTTRVLGPVWSGDIFCVEFINKMIMHVNDFSWGAKSKLLLMRILEEARCNGGDDDEPEVKRRRRDSTDSDDSEIEATFQPSFYFNTHKHHPVSQHLLKVTAIIDTLRAAGFRASRTHFEPECVRTNATLHDYIQLMDDDDYDDEDDDE